MGAKEFFRIFPCPHSFVLLRYYFETIGLRPPLLRGGKRDQDVLSYLPGFSNHYFEIGRARSAPLFSERGLGKRPRYY